MTAVESRAVTPRTAPTENPDELARLVVTCIDRPGVVARVSSFLAEHAANIVQSDQDTTGPSGGRFFLRIVFHLHDLAIQLPALEHAFAVEVARPLGADYSFRPVAARTRTVVFASRHDHCLLDLLWRTRRGELPVDVVHVVSNHPDLADDVAAFGIPFTHIPVGPGGKEEAERTQLELLRDCGTELVVLARYMQILSANFLHAVGAPVINIHHSFLPAFAGAGPYTRAKERGVKLIGATAHYATEDLDEGPIIEQDVVRVDHRATVAELTRRGADIERTVLARAVAWHCDDRVLVDGRTTVVF
ncbi:formyltetrahydrofolate deformylase [Pseudonocardia sp. NPDC046786]|uniref:formyltetrahydrofolate deformylase n=1 Tax=Pseudonocardia sp. NPDC046786 TaxID=3155471 RepID=UPI0033E949FB